MVPGCLRNLSTCKINFWLYFFFLVHSREDYCYCVIVVIADVVCFLGVEKVFLKIICITNRLKRFLKLSIKEMHNKIGLDFVHIHYQNVCTHSDHLPYKVILPEMHQLSKSEQVVFIVDVLVVVFQVVGTNNPTTESYRKIFGSRALLFEF